MSSRILLYGISVCAMNILMSICVNLLSIEDFVSLLSSTPFGFYYFSNYTFPMSNESLRDRDDTGLLVMVECSMVSPFCLMSCCGSLCLFPLTVREIF